MAGSATVRWVFCALAFLAPVLPFRTQEVRAEEDEDGSQVEQPFALAPDPEVVPGPDADLYVKAIALQAKGKYRHARSLFWKLIDKFPDSPYAPEAEDRSGPNAFLGIRPMRTIGPSERRIDVALMGDGYRIDKQRTYDKHCEAELGLLLGESVYGVYRPYFNFWQFNLASEDKGVDEPEPPPPDPALEERRRRRPKKTERRSKQYNTALDCKAAGPQGQVWANPERVWHYLRYLPKHDSLAICFAQLGRLGMGGMGIATTGPRGVVVHEFGHAFVGLLDEYSNNTGEPQGVSNAANVSTRASDPPWQHFLDARYPGVGIYEGAATFYKGVWRPAPGCAMNSGGGSPYCPVCREAAVLAIYEHVSPIDEVWPEEQAQTWARGSEVKREYRVVPMAPVGHDLSVKWILGKAPESTKKPDAEPEYDPEADDEGLDPFEARLRRKRRKARGEAEQPRALPAEIGFRPGPSRRARGTAHQPLPRGRVLRGKKVRQRGAGPLYSVVLPALPIGKHMLTVVVRDPAKPKNAKRPWVLKDERGLLEDRCHWLINVTP